MRAFLVLLLAYVLSQFYRAFLAVIANDLVRDLGLTPTELGNVSAIWFVTFALSQFGVGVALDRLGPRRTVSGLFLVAVAGAFWFSLATTYLQACLAMALIGIGCSPVLMGSMYYFGRTAPSDRFAFLGSMILGLGSLGNLLGAAPLAWTAASIGWRASVVAIAVTTALSAVLVYVVIRDPARIEAKGEGTDGLWAGLCAVFSLQPIQIMVPFILMSYASVAALRSLWVAPFFGEVHGFDVVARGNAALVMALAMTLGALAYGPLEKWIGSAKRTALLGSAVAILSLAGVALMGATSASLALILYAVFGFTAMTYAIVLAHARQFFPTHLLGRGVTTLNFMFIGGTGLLQLLSGRLVEASAAQGWAADATYMALHGAIALALLVATAIYAWAPERPAKPVA
jgi:MFS family permease